MWLRHQFLGMAWFGQWWRENMDITNWVITKCSTNTNIQKMGNTMGIKWILYGISPTNLIWYLGVSDHGVHPKNSRFSWESCCCSLQHWWFSLQNSGRWLVQELFLVSSIPILDDETPTAPFLLANIDPYLDSSPFGFLFLRFNPNGYITSLNPEYAFSTTTMTLADYQSTSNSNGQHTASFWWFGIHMHVLNSSLPPSYYIYDIYGGFLK